MDELVNKYQDQLDKAIALAEKINKEKSYLITLLIEDTSPQALAILKKYLEWTGQNESK